MDTPLKTSARRQSAEDILHRPIRELLVKLSLPAVIGLLIVGLNNFIDALFVGRLVGTEAVAALSLTWPLGIFVWGFSSALGEGGASMLSRAIGSANETVQHTMLSTLIGGAILIAAIISPLGFFMAETVLSLFGASGAVLDLALEYFHIYVCGMLFTVIGVSANMQIRAEGKLQRAMAYAVTSVLVNAALTPTLIVVFDLGMGGAAYATVASMVVYSVLNVAFLTSRKSSCRPDLRMRAFKFSQFTRALSLGMATLITNLTGSIQQLLILSTLARLGGDMEVALFGAAWRTLALPIFAVYGLVRALQPILGINFGADQFDRVREAVKVFAVAGLILMFVLWLPIFVFPQQILALTLPEFSFTDERIMQVRVMSVMLPGAPLIFMGMTLFQSLGHARMATMLALSRQVLLFVPAILILPLLFEVLGVYMAVVCVDLIMILIVVTFTLRFMKHLELQQLDRSSESLPPLTETTQTP